MHFGEQLDGRVRETRTDRAGKVEAGADTAEQQRGEHRPEDGAAVLLPADREVTQGDEEGAQGRGSSVHAAQDTDGEAGEDEEGGVDEVDGKEETDTLVECED